MGDETVRRGTGFAWDERFMWWDTGSMSTGLPWVQPEPNVDAPEPRRRLKNLLDACGLTARLTAVAIEPATVDDLALVHNRDYVERMRVLSAAGGGSAGDITPFVAGGFDIAALAAGAAISAGVSVLDGRTRNAYALVRPPGHHATVAEGGGYCMFNNLAVAIAVLRHRGLVDRVAVIDWDVHHGNGTQDIFYADPQVLTLSVHQDRNYPLTTGHLTERGTGTGVGANINVPLPPGSGHGAYLDCLDRVIVPALDRFRPDLIVVASGYDANAYDPLGRQLAHSGTYRDLTRAMLAAAARRCDDRLLVVHEGGYSTFYTPFCGLAVIEELSGIATGVDDPFLAEAAAYAGQDLQPHQRDLIDRAAALVADAPVPLARTWPAAE